MHAGWRYSSSSKVPALQAGSPELKKQTKPVSMYKAITITQILLGKTSDVLYSNNSTKCKKRVILEQNFCALMKLVKSSKL
jgi:hypothetical protein